MILSSVHRTFHRSSFFEYNTRETGQEERRPKPAAAMLGAVKFFSADADGKDEKRRREGRHTSAETERDGGRHSGKKKKRDHRHGGRKGKKERRKGRHIDDSDASDSASEDADSGNSDDGRRKKKGKKEKSKKHQGDEKIKRRGRKKWEDETPSASDDSDDNVDGGDSRDEENGSDDVFNDGRKSVNKMTAAESRLEAGLDWMVRAPEPRAPAADGAEALMKGAKEEEQASLAVEFVIG